MNLRVYTAIGSSFRRVSVTLTHPHLWSSQRGIPCIFTSNTLSQRSYSSPPCTGALPSNFQRQIFRPSLALILYRRIQSEQIRECSFQRNNMCKIHGARDAEVSGSFQLDATRELLPANVVPTHYELTIEPNFEPDDKGEYSFAGHGIIDLDVVEDSTSIVVNTHELVIKSTKVSVDGQAISSVPTLEHDKEAMTTKVSFESTLKKGSKAQLEMRFTGNLNDQLKGFYRSTYTNTDGSKGLLATTQMEPISARRAFPCFDEPALKAKFTITLIADQHLVCLSNMDVASEKVIESQISKKPKKAVKFNTTPPMSTYLVAFIVGDLKYIETNEFKAPIRVYMTPDQNLEHGQFSLNLAPKTLAFYEKTFGSEFPLHKMDMVAMPDFAMGAMENWGLITYRTTDLLLNEKTTNLYEKKRVAEVVQHELAHQWFGNLVTMDWWQGLWLNEGFATFMSLYSCDKFFPEWKVWESYVGEDMAAALELDSMRSSHPIEVAIPKAHMVDEIFDNISYAKGSCVLRMVSNHLGEYVFMEGVRLYMKRHAYGNTDTRDLWAALSAVSGEDVEKIMSIWTKRIGYPLVTVTETEDGIHVKQNRFLKLGDVKPEEDEVLYPVFLDIKTENGVEKRVLDTRELTVDLKNPKFYKLNANSASMYRVAYTPQHLKKLGEVARQGLLSVEDRTGIIADVGVLAQAGYQSTSSVLELFREFSNETEPVVWDILLDKIDRIRGAWQFEDETVVEGLQTYVKDLVSDKCHSLGWKFNDSDTPNEIILKSMLFSAAGWSGDKVVLEAAREMFAKYAAGDRDAIDKNICASVFSMVMKYGGKDEFETLLKTFRNSPTQAEKMRALGRLGIARQPELIQRTLDLALSSEVRIQDMNTPIASLSQHKMGALAFWEWLQFHWTTLEKILPGADSIKSATITCATRGLITEKHVAEVQKFFRDKKTEGFERTIDQSLERLRIAINWTNRDREDVKDWLKANGYAQVASTSRL